MEFNKHHELEGKHAYLSPSGYSWLNYDEEKMINYYRNQLKKEEGTYWHDLASRLIKTRTRVEDVPVAFNAFVNDAIGMVMESEVVLFYSRNVFGTADAIKFSERNMHLQIHDLKTGTSKPSFKQLEIYAALFCLEYNVDPLACTFENRLYQFEGYTIDEPDGAKIKSIMTTIARLDSTIQHERETYTGIFF